MSEHASGKKRRGWLVKTLAALAIVAVLAVGGIALFWVAPTPPMFEDGATLVDAEAQAAGSGRYVLAISTADWCALCQAYKRGALTDDAVEAWVAENATPVYVNVDEDSEAAARLKAQSKPGQLPVTTLLKDGQIVASHVGLLNASGLLSWLEQNSSPTEQQDDAPSADEGESSSS